MSWWHKYYPILMDIDIKCIVLMDIDGCIVLYTTHQHQQIFRDPSPHHLQSVSLSQQREASDPPAPQHQRTMGGTQSARFGTLGS